MGRIKLDTPLKYKCRSMKIATWCNALDAKIKVTSQDDPKQQKRAI